jgi:type I restriction enzyme S subunit
VAETTAETAFNQGCRGLVPRAELDLRFFRYQLLARRDDLVALGQGSTFTELSSDALAAFEVSCPSPSEQRRVADFLDAETTRIDALIDKKRSMIKRLVERQSAIADREIEDAAVSYIRLSLLLALRISDGPHETPEFLDEGVPFLSVDNVVGGRLVFDGARRISSDAHRRYAMKCRPQRGDVIVTKAAAIGRVALVEEDVEFNIWSPLAVLRPDQSQMRSDFLYHAMRTTAVQDQIQLLASSNTQQNVAMSDLASLRIPVMSLIEQERIAAALTTSQQQVTQLSGRLESSIHLLEEHRQALITAAVTGQLDIAKAAV